MLQPSPFAGSPRSPGRALSSAPVTWLRGAVRRGLRASARSCALCVAGQLPGPGLVTVHFSGRAPTAHVEHQGYKWETALLNCPISHRLTQRAAGSEVRLDLVVKPEQENDEPIKENIQLTGIHTVCLRREWCFNVFPGLAHRCL